MSHSENSIGIATMEADGTIVLRLCATIDGITSDATLTYRVNDEQYSNILAHIGPLLQPGEHISVRPWDTE